MQYFDYSNQDDDKTLDEFTVLDNFTDDDWKMLVKHAQTINFSAGEMLLHAGETDDGVYILVNGRVEVIKKGGFGKQKSIAEINEGSIFGELSFFDEQPRSAAIRAITDGQVLHLTHTGFDQFAAWSPALARQLLFDMGRVLAYRFRQATSSVI